jgi:hypothetical protein
LGVLIFQIRCLLDSFDGVVFRAHMKNQRYKSYYGDVGYYVDALSDILGGTCLIIGCLLYFSKQRPLRLKTRQINQSLSPHSNSPNEIVTDSMILNLEDEQTTPSINDINNCIVETKETVLIALSLFALRYSLSAMFWDRYVRAYEDLLDSYTNKAQRQVRIRNEFDRF